MFKNNIKSYRQLRRMTQMQLAKKVGVARSTMCMYETGEREPSFETLEAIADTLNVSFLDLFGRDESSYIKGSNQYATAMRPLVGSIACGAPILAEENIECLLAVPDGVDCDFMLRCRGDSMTGARIMDGDIVYIRQMPEVENGQIAAVRIGEEATLKRFYQNGETVTLMPDNPKYPPQIYIGPQLDEIQVLGLAVAFTSTIH